MEGLLAELDEAEEYFVDEVEGDLYFVWNGTAGQQPPRGNGSKLGVVTLQNLLSIQGEGAGPEAKAVPRALARDITIRGIGFRDAGASYMNPHGMPGAKASTRTHPPPPRSAWKPNCCVLGVCS